MTPVDALDRVFEKTRVEFQKRRYGESSAAPPETNAFSPNEALESTDFELNLADAPVSESAAPRLDDFETYFLAELEREGLVNAWQAEQLRRGRARFCLGDYRVVDLLGRGGYGNVFLGRRRSNVSNRDASGAKFASDVALKVLPLAVATPSATRKFLHEIEVAKRLDHENIVRLLDASKDAAVHYAVYEYVDGGDARRLLARYERLPARVAAYVISETAKALVYLHEQGVVHRDVKPGNILLMKNGEVKLGDFGFISAIVPFSSTARLSPLGAIVENSESDADSPGSRSRSKIKGTPDYMAPDQILNPDAPSPRWDVYSLGSALYFMLTGVVPFPSVDSDDKLRAHLRSAPPPEPSSLAPNVPPEISRLTMRMLERDPERRVSTAQEVVDALRRWTPTRSELAESDLLSSIRRRDADDDFWSEENLQIAFSRPLSPSLDESPERSRAVDRKERFSLFGKSRRSESTPLPKNKPAKSADANARGLSEPQNFDQAFALARREAGRSVAETPNADALANFEEAFGFVEQAFESVGAPSPAPDPPSSRPSSQVVPRPVSNAVSPPPDADSPEFLDERTRRLERLNALLIRRVLVPLLALTSLALAATLFDAFF
ncbi:MAG: serine/threonine protein kinase [Thermoguttaceae bacterium]|nr:serine/threonine protein kinase [Thermoguttaceae bacterium]